MASYANSAPIQEYQVKASFLLKFVKFVTYPQEVFTGTNVNVCVLGKDPFQGFLDTLIKNAKDAQVQGHPIAIHYLDNIEATLECQAIFVSQSEQKQLGRILAQVKSRPILTVSDMADFTTQGGMIQLYTTGNKVSFTIDPTTAAEANLKISAQLLQLAKVMKKSSD